MVKVKLTKTELKAQTDALKRFRRFLPMLQLKKQQLQAEIAAIVQFCGAQRPAPADYEVLKAAAPAVEAGNGGAKSSDLSEETLALLRQAAEIILTEQRSSITYLQRKLGIGYNKSAALCEELEKRGILGAPDGKKNREILVSSPEELDALL